MHIFPIPDFAYHDAELLKQTEDGKIGNVTMPDITDDGPKIAELGRFMADFRSEVREALNQVVRKDVYAANLAALEIKIESVIAENRRLSQDLERERTERIQDSEKERTERRNNNGKVLGALFAGGLSLIGWIVQVLSK